MADTSKNSPDRIRRILVVDDNQGTQADFRKVLVQPVSGLDEIESLLFGDDHSNDDSRTYEIEGALHGEAGLAMIMEALECNRPYDLAFVDLRMPPGWDGYETITRIWQVDPDLEIVLCAAFLGCSHEQAAQKLGNPTNFAVVEKPFESAYILTLARDLSDRCRKTRKISAPAP